MKRCPAWLPAVLTAALLLPAACQKDSSSATHPPPGLEDAPASLEAVVPNETTRPRPSPDRATHRASADDWTPLLRSPDPAQRELAARAWASLDSPAAAPVLRALAAETRPALQTLLLRALGACLEPPLSAFQAALETPDAVRRAGACLGLARAPFSRHDLPYAAIARTLHGDASEALGCVRALAALPLPDPAQEPDAAHSLVADLLGQLDHPDPRLRQSALHALARYPDAPPSPLAAATRDPDWRVAAAAFAALATHADAETYLDALSPVLAAAQRDPGPIEGTGVRTWEAALRGAARFASKAVFLSTLETALDAFTAAHLDGPRPAPARVAAAHCELAALVDTGRRWPGRLRACGDGQAPALLVAEHEARIVARQPSDPALRASYLLRMLRSDPQTRLAVLPAYSHVHHTSLAEPLVDALREPAPLLLALAARAALELSPVLNDPAARPLRDALAGALAEAARAVPRSSPVSVRVALAEALDAYGRPVPASPFADHPSPDVRRATGASLAGVLLPPPPDDAQPVTVRLRLAEGDVVLALEPSLAPRGVAALRHALERGWLRDAVLRPSFDGRTLRLGHPDAALPAGAPAWLPRELPWTDLEAGTVALLPAAEHSASLALVVSFAHVPAQRAGPTPVGHVRAGLPLLAGALYGERIRGVEVVPTP